jgi:hypothetical protein
LVEHGGNDWLLDLSGVTTAALSYDIVMAGENVAAVPVVDASWAACTWRGSEGGVEHERGEQRSMREALKRSTLRWGLGLLSSLWVGLARLVFPFRFEDESVSSHDFSVLRLSGFIREIPERDSD